MKNNRTIILRVSKELVSQADERRLNTNRATITRAELIRRLLARYARGDMI